MALVVPNMVRLRTKGRMAGNRVEQVFDFRVEHLGATNPSSRTDTIEEILIPDFVGGWENHILPHLSSTYTFDGVEAVDLDVDNGQVWEESSGSQGGNPGDPLPSNVSAVVRKVSNRVRGARSGRFFLGGLVDAAASGNVLLSGTKSEIQGGVNALYSAVEESGSAMGYIVQWSVIHTRDGVPWGVSPVSGFSVEAALSHQDRRIRVR